MSWVIEAVQALALFGGAAFLLIGGVGVLRLPDVFTRVHAAGLADTMGAALVLVGLMLETGWDLITAKLILILLFLWLTSPVSSHALAKIALKDGHQPLLADDEGEEPPSNS